MDRASIISRTTDSARNEVAPETFKNDRRSPQQDSIVQINASRFQESEISEHSNVKRVETVGTTDEDTNSNQLADRPRKDGGTRRTGTREDE